MNLISVYCFTDRKPLLPEPVVIDIEGIYAAATLVPAEEYAEEAFKKNLRDIDWIESRVRRHEAVSHRLMKDATVLPCKFPTLFFTEDNVRTFITANKDGLLRLFAALTGKEEWSVKAYWNNAAHKAAVLLKDISLLQLDDEIAAAQPGKAFWLKKKKDERLAVRLKENLEELLHRAFESLRQASVQFHLGTLLPREATGRDAEMVLNAAFLIERPQVDAFVRLVNQLSATLAPDGITLECSGAFPPYHFSVLPPAARIESKP